MQDIVESARPASTTASGGGAVRRLFVSRDGRVALAWRLVLYFVAIVGAQALGAGASLLARALGAPQQVRGLAMAVAYAGATLALVRLVRRRVDHRPAGMLGLGGAARGPVHALAGAAVALAMLAAVVAVEVAAGWVRVEDVVPWDATVAGRVASSFFVMCAIGFCEELVFRGAFLANLAERRSVAFATAVSALIFGAAHVLSAPPSPAVLVSALTVTALLVASRLHTGALWWAIGWHAAWDFGQHDVFGLSHPGASGPTALVRLAQSGPARWIGTPEFLESGLVVIAVQGAAASILVLAAARSRRRVRWGEPLDGAGLAEPTPPAQ
jgi:uncharacterized protein